MASIILVGAAETPARADPSRSECVDDNGKAQDARRDHHFSAARQLLRQCSLPSCPDLVRDDCSKRLDELERAQPTIVFSVTDASGKDLLAVKVSVDGNILTEKVDGTALNVDPGAHEFTFEVAGQPPATRTIVIREGEKERSEKVILGDAPYPQADRRPVAQLVVSTEQAATIVVDGTTVAKGRFDGPLAPGPHDVQVTEPGKVAYRTQVDLHDGEARKLDVTLDNEKRATLVWPWLVAGGAVVVGASVGGYFLFKSPQEAQHAPLTGTLGTVRFTSWP